MKLSKSQIAFLALSALYIALTYFSRHFAFFGDMIQFASRHANYYYENNFKNFWLSNDLDSGHPQVFGMYMAFMWKIFGRTLAVSHVVMLPYLIGIAYAISKLLNFIEDKWVYYFACLLVFMEPTLFAQAMLCSPDIVLVCFFLLSLIAIQQGNRFKLSIYLIPLALISLRGMMVCAAIFIGCILVEQLKGARVFPTVKKYIVTFLPAAVLAFTWLLAHYSFQGWIGFHSDSPWASSFESVELIDMGRNLLLIGWRIIDFGRIGIVLILVVVLFYNQDLLRSQWTAMYLALGICLIAGTIFATGLIGHRYFLPMYLVQILMLCLALQVYKKKKQILLLAACVTSSLIGSFMIYPENISMGWDSTPAHVPYYELRTKMMQEVRARNIPLKQIGCGFPNLDPLNILELNASTERFSSYNDTGISYLLYSNIFNYPEAQIQRSKQGEKIWSEEKSGIKMELIRLR